MCLYGSNNHDYSADKYTRFESNRMEEDLNFDCEIEQRGKVNVESVIYILCKFVFPGGNRIEDISEVLFTHLKGDHGILHNHLDLLKCSMVPVTSTQSSRWSCELPKSEKRKKRIGVC